MNLEECVVAFIEFFPEHEQTYREHIDFNEELLGHVFFGDAINLPLTQLLKENIDIESIQKYIDFIDYMYITVCTEYRSCDNIGILGG